MNSEKWLLPDGIDEFLPREAKLLEKLRRRLLVLFDSWGYDLIVPPMVEYLDSLLTGTGNDLNVETFKLIDQVSGRTMGIRADITPQVARIDAHQIGKQGLTRLCYIGTVLHTKSSDLSKSRSIKQIGAELYGHAGFESEIEIITLMLTMLESLGLTNLHLDLSHVGVYKDLIFQADLDSTTEVELFTALQRKSLPDIHQILHTVDIPAELKSMLISLPTLHGGIEVLDKASKLLANAAPEVLKNISVLRQVADSIQQQFAHIELHFDLAELRGYQYHTGTMFAVYLENESQPIAQGGRYDNIGETFGRARPATGFSADLKALIRLDQKEIVEKPGIFAAWPQDKTLRTQIKTLRESGERVVCGLPGQHGDQAQDGQCDRIFTGSEKDGWVVTNIECR